MRDGSEILTRNNFAGRTNLPRIFAGQVRDGLARFATPRYKDINNKKVIIVFFILSK